MREFVESSPSLSEAIGVVPRVVFGPYWVCFESVLRGIEVIAQA